MDNFELKTEPKAKRKPIIWNILTVIVLLAACGLAYLFLTIFQNPTMLPASLLPAELPTHYLTPTLTSTIIQLAPTWTPTLTVQPSPTRTKVPTWTSVPELITPTATIDEGTATITSTAMPGSADISYAASTTMHPELACKWMGVGGTVMDVNDKPLLFQTIQVGGTLNGQAVTGLALSGDEPAYGTSGFEIKLADSASDSSQTLWIQLFNADADPLTDKVYFDTFSDCQKNLVMIVFKVTQ